MRRTAGVSGLLTPERLRQLLGRWVVELVDSDGAVSTGFLVSDKGHFLTCWHVLQPGPLFITVRYRGLEVKAEVQEELSNPNCDVGVIKVSEADLKRLKEAGLEPAPLGFPPELGRIKADPVAAFGYQRAKTFGEPLLLRGAIDADNTPLSVKVDIPGATGGYQTCICFSCRSWEVDKGMSGAPLLNLRTGFVEGIVCGVPVKGMVCAFPGLENQAVTEATGEAHPYPWGLAVPLSDVKKCWKNFAADCRVSERQPVVDENIVPQVKEFERHKDFIERPSWKEKVESFQADPDTESGYLLLIAGPGAGKSAFMAHCIDEAAAPIFHFIRRDEPGWDDPERMFRSLVAQLVRKYGLTPNQSLIERLESAGTESEKILAAAELFSNTLELVSVVLDHQTEREIIWIDGLDEAFGPTGRFRDQPGLPGLLPARLPKGIYIVLSSRPGDHLSWLRDPELCVIEHLDSDKERPAAIADVKRFFEEHAHEVDPPLCPEFVDEVAERTQGNFYIATRVLEELKRDPAAPRDAGKLPGTVWEFHARTWERVVRKAREAGISEGAVREVLGMLAAAQEPLSLEHLQAFGASKRAEEILEFAGEWFSPRPGYRDPALPFEFNHASVPEFLLSELTSKELEELHAKLAAACARWRDFSGKVREYALRYRFSHLVRARDWQGLAEGLADDEFVVERAGLEGFGPIHKDVLSTLGVPELPPEWKEAFGFYERFLRFRIERLNSFPRAYAQEVVNEFLSQAPESFANPLKKLERRVHLRKISGPPALGTLEHPGAVTCLAFSPDGELLASGSRDGTVKIWKARTGELVAECTGHKLWVLNVAFSPDGELLASGSYGEVKIWETRTGQLVANCTGHKGNVLSVAFSPDGELLASGDEGGVVKIWEAKTGRLVADCVSHKGEAKVLSVAFSPDGELLAAGDVYGTVEVWKARSGERLSYWACDAEEVCTVAFSPNGKLLASEAWGGITVWEAMTDRLVLDRLGFPGRLFSIAFSADGELLASGGDNGVRIWNVRSGQLLAEFTGHKGAVLSVAFSPSCELLASGDKKGTVKIWNVRTRKPVAECAGHKGRVLSMALSLDGKLLASGNCDGTVKIRKARSGQLLAEFTGHKGAIRSVAFSPSCELVASRDEKGTVKIWKARTAELVAEWRGYSFASIAFSQNEELLALGSLRGIEIWDVRISKLVAYVGRDENVSSLAFSPDDELLASGSIDGTVKIWQAGTGELMAECTGHVGMVSSLAFSPDGRLLASGSSDGRVKTWEARSGRLVAESAGHKREVTSVSFSPDGELLASASGDRTVRLWEVESGRCLSTLFFDAVPTKLAITSNTPPRLVVATEAEQVFLYELRTPLPLHPETVG